MDAQLLRVDGSNVIRYAYNQILVFDESELAPGCLWTEAHWHQGFARREKTVAYATLKQYGVALLNVYAGRPQSIDAFTRLICVPLEVPTGRLHIEGPEEYPTERLVNVKAGTYAVFFGQRFDSGHELVFELFIDNSAVPSRSDVLIADDGLHVPREPVETAAIA